MVCSHLPQLYIFAHSFINVSVFAEKWWWWWIRWRKVLNNLTNHFSFTADTFHVLKNLTQKEVYLLSQACHPAGGIGYNRSEFFNMCKWGDEVIRERKCELRQCIPESSIENLLLFHLYIKSSRLKKKAKHYFVQYQVTSSLQVS